MKFRTTKSLLFIAALTVVLGFFSVLSAVDHLNMRTCPYAFASGGQCPPMADGMAQIQHHISSVQRLAMGVLGHVVLPFAEALFALFFTPYLLLIAYRKIRDQFKEHANYSPNRKRLFWIALHNKCGELNAVWARKRMMA